MFNNIIKNIKHLFHSKKYEVWSLVDVKDSDNSTWISTHKVHCSKCNIIKEKKFGHIKPNPNDFFINADLSRFKATKEEVIKECMTWNYNDHG
jgi:hypothetical protein